MQMTKAFTNSFVTAKAGQTKLNITKFTYLSMKTAFNSKIMVKKSYYI